MTIEKILEAVQGHKNVVAIRLNPRDAVEILKAHPSQFFAVSENFAPGRIGLAEGFDWYEDPAVPIGCVQLDSAAAVTPTPREKAGA